MLEWQCHAEMAYSNADAAESCNGHIKAKCAEVIDHRFIFELLVTEIICFKCCSCIAKPSETVKQYE